jgi:DNA-binding PadR family transcriptional regulator
MPAEVLPLFYVLFIMYVLRIELGDKFKYRFSISVIDIMYEKKILLGFIRVHILHHAAEKDGIYGVWMIKELERHGYSISPGTLYPILHEMETNGLLKVNKVKVNGKIRKVYSSTKKGKETLNGLKAYIAELSKEVV